MKLNELIKELKKLQTVHGDLEVRSDGPHGKRSIEEVVFSIGDGVVELLGND